MKREPDPFVQLTNLPEPVGRVAVGPRYGTGAMNMEEVRLARMSVAPLRDAVTGERYVLLLVGPTWITLEPATAARLEELLGVLMEGE